MNKSIIVPGRGKSVIGIGMTVPCFQALGEVPLCMALLRMLCNNSGCICETSFKIRLEMLLIPKDLYILMFLISRTTSSNENASKLSWFSVKKFLC